RELSRAEVPGRRKCEPRLASSRDAGENHEALRLERKEVGAQHLTRVGKAGFLHGSAEAYKERRVGRLRADRDVGAMDDRAKELRGNIADRDGAPVGLLRD